MIELDAIKTELLTYVAPLAEVRDSLDLTNKEERAKELEREMQEPTFWDNPEKANAKTRELKSLKDDIEICNHLTTQINDIQDLIEMANEENDTSMVEDITNEFESFKEEFEKIRISTLLNEEYHAEMQDAGQTLQQTKEFAEGTVVDELVDLGSSSLDAAQKTFEAIDAIAQTVEKVCSIVGDWQEGIIGKIGGAISSLFGR